MLRFHTVIIGSGAAGYAAANNLISLGIKDIALLTDNRMAGTSRNAGSDKQTYYKLSCTDEDSPQKMARALCFGGGMHKDTAFIEAVNSLPCFIRLAEYGVPFPKDKYGRFVGYKTDHDAASRGSSAGPLTSKYMTECLERRVLNSKSIKLLENMHLVKIVTEAEKAIGLIALKKVGEGCELTAIQAKYIIAATGGAAAVYQNTVYPKSQCGAMGILAEAGCIMNNICEWQYGISSTKVRWNLSGSYQQVVPRYFAINESGEEIEFLENTFSDKKEIFNNTFLKGYQWPFDSKKTDTSSQIDLAVSHMLLKGYRVFMDYRKNPNGFSMNLLSDEAYHYLSNANCDGNTPYERLLQLNPQAIDFYKKHGIDLETEPLEISVCAQHMNGGAEVDCNWQTNIKGLFVIGEAAGTFGIYRPGGSALNSTQVGALRCAEYIAGQKETKFEISEKLMNCLKEEKNYVIKCLNSKNKQIDFSKEMSLYAAQVRHFEKIEKLNEKIGKQLGLKYYSAADNTYKSICALYIYKDTLRFQQSMCNTLLKTIPETGSRGGSICKKDNKILEEHKEWREYVVKTIGDKVVFEHVRPFPNTDYVFENVWKAYS